MILGVTIYVWVMVCGVLCTPEPTYEIQRQTDCREHWAFVSRHQQGTVKQTIKIFYRRQTSEFELIKSAFPDCGKRPKIYLFGFEASR